MMRRQTLNTSGLMRTHLSDVSRHPAYHILPLDIELRCPPLSRRPWTCQNASTTCHPDYESTDQCSRCLDVSPDGDHREDTQDMSLQHVPSSYLCPPTYGRRIMTSVTSTSAADVSSGVDYHRDGEETSLRRASSSYQPPLTHGDDWEERIALVCMEYGLMKHCQAQYRERAIKIVDEFAGNEPEKMAKGSSKYYNTILKTFTCLATKYRQNHDSK
jgi:hypothetical protein